MATYSLGVRVGWSAFGPGPVLEVRTSALANARIIEMTITSAQADMAPVFGIGRPAAIGGTPVGLWPFQAEDPGDPPALTQLAFQWQIAPTAPANAFRRYDNNNVVGPAVIWSFPKGLLIQPASSIVLWNFVAAAPGVGLHEISTVIRE